MKKYFILSFLFILVLSGCDKEMNETVDENNDQKLNEVVEDDSSVYKNEKYGFEIDFPGDIEKLEVEEKKIKKEESIFGSEGEVTLYFNYQLDKEISDTEKDSSLGNIRDMSIFYFKIVPKKDWKENACDEIKADSFCRQGKKLGENDEYVFESGFTSIEGAGSLCVKNKEEQKEFCEVDEKFNEGMKNNNLNFKNIKQ